MLTLNDTSLETFRFGNTDEDIYYILVNLKQNPNGVDIQRLASVEPRTFDAVLASMGCLFMLTGIEVTELISRREIDSNELHSSLFKLAKQEGVIP